MRINILLFFFCICSALSAQHFDFAFEIGKSNYLGDLSNFDLTKLVSAPDRSKSYKAGFGNKYATLYLNYTYAEVSAFDFNSDNQSNVLRNLNFRSPIYELGIQSEINLVGLFTHRYSKFNPLLIMGINLFEFFPQALYDNQWHDLPSLGTEGQYLNGNESYKLRGISLPLGFAFKYQLNYHLWIGAGFRMNWTFTDYLDDVSGTYTNPENLSDFAAELAYRTDEINDNSPIPKPDSMRGNPNDNDKYMSSYITIGYKFRKGKILKNYCPSSK